MRFCFVINNPCASQDLASDLEAGDGQAFADHLAEFDSMTRLDKWKTTLLLKVPCALPGPLFEELPCITSGRQGPTTMGRAPARAFCQMSLLESWPAVAARHTRGGQSETVAGRQVKKRIEEGDEDELDLS